MTTIMKRIPGKQEDASASTPMTLSTKNVVLLPGMPGSPECRDGEDFREQDRYEKPGYVLCSFVDGFIETQRGAVPRVKTVQGRDDIVSTIRVRCGIGRSDYRVAPGLYGVGHPDGTSEVLVTANFKLSFDHLRRCLNGRNLWLLVLDTRGVNVWCAAGKGTFSTGELVHRIKKTGLSQVVDHQRIIVPQLGATGVAAREVQKGSGFRVVYGPVRAWDIPRFLDNRRRVEPGMRKVSFTVGERLILTPVEVRLVVKPVLITAVVLMILSGIGSDIFSLDLAWERGRAGLILLLAGVFSGTVLTPVLLPWLPFRYFGAKGIVSGSVVALCCLFLPIVSMTGTGTLALFLFSVAISSYLAMNFTGATPFTSPSGVEKEMKRFIPVQALLIVISTVLWIYSAF